MRLVVTTVVLRRERRLVLGVVVQVALALFANVLVTSLDLSAAEEGTEVAGLLASSAIFSPNWRQCAS